MKAIPADLVAQVCEVDINVTATERLAGIYHRNLARRLVSGISGTQRATVQDAVRQVQRLSPAAAHAVYRNNAAMTGAGVVQLLDESRSVRDAEIYAGGTDDLWVHEGLSEVLRSLGWSEPDVGTIMTRLPGDLGRSVELARQALLSSWPEAWAEHNRLIRYLVFVEGPVRSATLQSTFGAIYAEVQEARNPLRMFELLLHESGHHALLLREQFGRFLENPDELGAHALRPDERPLRGVLHAAFVMCRISEGLRRYQLRHPSGGPLDGCPVAERIDFTRESLRSTLAVLDQKARWNAEGRVLRERLETYTGRTEVFR